MHIKSLHSCFIIVVYIAADCAGYISVIIAGPHFPSGIHMLTLFMPPCQCHNSTALKLRDMMPDHLTFDSAST